MKTQPLTRRCRRCAFRAIAGCAASSRPLVLWGALVLLTLLRPGASFATVTGFVNNPSTNSSDFATAATGLGATINTDVNFDTHPLGTLNNSFYTLSDGVTLTPSGANINTVQYGVGPLQGNTQNAIPGEGPHPASNYLFVSSPPANLVISFNAPVTGVGLFTIDYFNPSPYNNFLTIEAFTGQGGTGVSLGVFTSLNVNLQNDNLYFMGLVSTNNDIQSLVFTRLSDNTGDVIGIDDIRFATLGQTQLPAAFWLGNTDNTWTNANWATNASGNTTTLTPSSVTDVTFSATGAANQDTTLGADFTIHSLTINDPAAVTISGSNTLTISGTDGTTGITVNSGAGRFTVNSNLILDGSSRTITVSNNAGMAVSGIIGGTIGLTKEGAGTLMLTGSNNYSGGTTINAGMIILGDGFTPHASLGTDDVTVNSGGTLTLDLANNEIFSNNITDNYLVVLDDEVTSNYTVSSAISGTGSVIKAGANTVILTGSSTYTGNTTIDGGLLQVDGSIVSDVIINPDGILGGNGSVGGITNSGIVSPGDSPGTLVVAGNYTQTSAGTLNIQIASAGSFDLLAVGGAANLAGTLAIQRLNNYSPLNEAKFTILTAAGGVNGTFGTVSNGFAVLPLLDLNVLYNPNDVTLEFLANFTRVPNLTPNQSAVAGALTTARNSPGLQDAINYLLFRSTAELHNDFDLIAPDELTSIFTIGFSGADVQNANIERHLEQVRNGASGYTSTGFTATSKDGKAVVVDGKKVVVDNNPVTPESKRWSFFIEGSGEFTSVDSTNNASGYDFTTAGVTLGVDYRVNDNFAIGITGGYVNSEAGLVNQGGINLNGGKGGVYATVFGNGFYADALVGAGYNSYDTTRASLQGYAYGGADGWELDTLLNGGYNFQYDRLTFGPIVSLAYTQIHLDSFTETGSLTPFYYPNQSQASLRTNLGGKISYSVQFRGITITPEVRVSWQHEYLDSTQSIGSQLSGGPVFTVNGPVVGRDSALVSAGVNVQITPTISVYSYYDGQFGRQNFSSNNVSGGVKIDF